MVRFGVSFVLAAVSVGVIGASGASATPHCQPCPYSCYDLNLGDKDCSEITRSGNLCCVDLTRKGLELAQELERARAQQGGGNRPGRGDSSERCPAGFQPSEQKCSPDERRRGCKDIRLPNGLGCVRR